MPIRLQILYFFLQLPNKGLNLEPKVLWKKKADLIIPLRFSAFLLVLHSSIYIHLLECPITPCITKKIAMRCKFKRFYIPELFSYLLHFISEQGRCIMIKRCASLHLAKPQIFPQIALVPNKQTPTLLKIRMKISHQSFLVLK